MRVLAITGSQSSTEVLDGDIPYKFLAAGVAWDTVQSQSGVRGPLYPIIIASQQRFSFSMSTVGRRPFISSPSRTSFCFRGVSAAGYRPGSWNLILSSPRRNKGGRGRKSRRIWPGAAVGREVQGKIGGRQYGGETPAGSGEKERRGGREIGAGEDRRFLLLNYSRDLLLIRWIGFVIASHTLLVDLLKLKEFNYIIDKFH